MKNFLASLERRGRIGLALGATVLALATACALWWALAPSQQLLFGNLRQNDAAEIVRALDEWKIPHTIVDGGTGITVDEDLVYKTRMKLVSEGVPRGGHVGFELFDDSDFGVTEFAQRINYQRALQGEIERTISALPAVATARVHLTIRRPGLFVGDREASKASVALTLRAGEALERGQVAGIRSLVAAAVEGLDPAQVTVIDSDGSLLAGSPGAAPAMGERSEDEVRLEAAIESKVSELLEQVLRSDQYRVTVDASLNFDTVHEVSEDASTLEHGTARREVSRAPGRIERLSVAVVLPSTIDDYDLPELQGLIAAAAGLDPARGDRLEVSPIGRGQPARIEPEPVVETMALSDPAARMQAPAWRGAADWMRWLPMLALGLFLGAVGAFAIPRKARALTVVEREAALQRLRQWLGEDEAP